MRRRTPNEESLVDLVCEIFKMFVDIMGFSKKEGETIKGYIDWAGLLIKIIGWSILIIFFVILILLAYFFG